MASKFETTINFNDLKKIAQEILKEELARVSAENDEKDKSNKEKNKKQKEKIE